MYMYAYAGIFFADLVIGKIHKKFPRWRASVNDLPTMFKVYINVDGRSIKLSLTFNPRLSACVKVYPESDGWCRSAKVSRSRRENCIIANMYLPVDWCSSSQLLTFICWQNVDRFYQDPRHGASLLVKVSAEGLHNIVRIIEDIITFGRLRSTYHNCWIYSY